MPTYVYEEIQKNPKRYEIRQSIKDAPLTHHPETGKAIRRVIAGPAGILTGSSSSASAGHTHSAGCGCGR
jgi:predicted nucleic acid-binding Zn ribbon protein